MSLGTVHLNPGISRVARWAPSFSPEGQNHTNIQVWVRITGLLIEYWQTIILYNIARGCGLPLKIDRKILDVENGLDARILVDVDMAAMLPEKILVKRKNFNFFIGVIYENFPRYCPNCSVIGHDVEGCW